MSTKEGVVLASRTLATLLVVWVFSDLCSLPRDVYSFLRHGNTAVVTAASEYWHHYYLMTLSFTLVRIVGFSLTARWLYSGRPEVAQFFLPSTDESAPLPGA